MTPPSGPASIRVLVVEDDGPMREILVRHLDRMGYAVRGAAGAAGALVSLRETETDVILTDVRMPGMDGRTLLQVVRQQHAQIRVILMTAFGSVGAAVEAMQAGAYSYVTKPFKVDEIAAILRNVTREILLTREVAHLTRAVGAPYSVDRLIGNSPAMQDVRRQLLEAAALRSPVLITGPSGTGKELAARAIHHSGPRNQGPFVPVNCSAIPETLFENEMFGHRRGAFSGALDDQAGIIEQSSGGTLFLDEVGEIPRSQQAKLLRVIEENEVRRLGDLRSHAVDLRVLCATNRDLMPMVNRGEFREDLYFRLNVLEIPMPDLASRPEDIPALADHLLSDLIARAGIPCHGFDGEALEVLASHRWPGNVRELRNVIERSVVRACGRRIGAGDLPAEIRGIRPGEILEGPPLPPSSLRSLAEVEREYIDEVLRACGWNRSAAARVLAVDRRTLFNKIRRHGLVGSRSKPPPD